MLMSKQLFLSSPVIEKLGLRVHSFLNILLCVSMVLVFILV